MKSKITSIVLGDKVRYPVTLENGDTLLQTDMLLKVETPTEAAEGIEAPVRLSKQFVSDFILIGDGDVEQSSKKRAKVGEKSQKMPKTITPIAEDKGRSTIPLSGKKNGSAKKVS